MDTIICPACGTTVLPDMHSFEEDLPCPKCGLLVSMCENCGRGYSAIETGVDGHCITCSEDIWAVWADRR